MQKFMGTKMNTQIKAYTFNALDLVCHFAPELGLGCIALGENIKDTNRRYRYKSPGI